MAFCPSLQDINNFLVAYKNQFDRYLYQKDFQFNPYVSLFPKAMYNYSEGVTPQVITTSYELPTQLPIGTAIGSITLSSGTGSSCTVEPELIRSGSTIRNYSLQTKAFNTPTFCLTDLQFDYQAEQQMANLQEGLSQFMTRWWSMWYQAQSIGMVDTKISTLTNCQTNQVTSSAYEYTGIGLTLPTAELEWCHLNPLYDQLAIRGGTEFAVGSAGGMPTYALTVGPGYKRKLWQTDSLTRETVNWGDAFENFTARGINTSINGFIPNVDILIPRYDAAMRYIPPYLNVDATNGRKFIPNPAYRTPTNGGNATYEAFFVQARDIFEVRVAPGTPANFAGASFRPQNYAGEVQWINNPDMCYNQLGDKGFYRLDVRVAAKPIWPDLGFAGLTLAKD